MDTNITTRRNSSRSQDGSPEASLPLHLGHALVVLAGSLGRGRAVVLPAGLTRRNGAVLPAGNLQRETSQQPELRMNE